MKKNKISGIIILFLCSFFWGSTFVAQKESVGVLGEWMYTGLRFILGGIIVFPFALYFSLKEKREAKKSENIRTLLTGGIVCGFLLALASILQQKGIETTEIGKAAFLTGLYSVLVPFVTLLLFKEKYPLNVYFGVMISLAGLYLLCDISSFSVKTGDLYLIGSALAFSFQIVFISFFSKKCNSFRLAFLQMISCGIICLVLSLILEKNNTFSDIIRCVFPLLYAGILSCGVAYTFQVVGQKLCTNATIATLIMSLEAPVSSLCQVIVYSVFMTTFELIGSILMFAAIILSQIDIKKIIDGMSYKKGMDDKKS